MEEQLPQEILELRHNASAVSVRARDIAEHIKDQESINDALAWCSGEQTIVDNVIARLSAGKKAAHLAWKKWCDLECDATESRIESIRFVKATIGRVQMELNRTAREAEEKALAEARKKDEEERLKRAEHLEKSGNATAAQAVLSEAGNFIAPVMDKPKPEGGTVRTEWKVREPVKMTRELLLWLTGKPGYENAVTLNIKWLEHQAKLMAGNMPKMPGVEFYEKPVVSIAARRSA